MNYLIFFFWILSLFLPFSVNADKTFFDKVLRKYDPNTEVFLRGKVKRIWILPKYNFVILDVRRKKLIYKVAVAPLEYVKKMHIYITPEDEIIVKGSKFFTKKGEIFILTRVLYIINKDCLYYLRDKNFKPLW